LLLFVGAPQTKRGGFGEGPPKKIDGPSRTFAKSQTHPPADLFLSTLFGVTRQGDFKNTTQTFLSKTFPKKIDKIFNVRFSSFFWFYRVFAVKPTWVGDTRREARRNRGGGGGRRDKAGVVDTRRG
jgi:hypothetical protein